MIGASIFCTVNCGKYFYSSGCSNNNTNRALGLCTFEYVSVATCVASCTGVTEYLITANNDKVCGQASCIGTIDETQTNLPMTCGACAAPKAMQLSTFCVASCINYFNTHCSTLAIVDNTGECRRPIVENNVCMVTTVNAVTGMGDSSDYLGCTSGMYLLNYVCVACNQAGQWIDYQGVNCLTACDIGDDILYSSTLRLCRT